MLTSGMLSGGVYKMGVGTPGVESSSNAMWGSSMPVSGMAADGTTYVQTTAELSAELIAADSGSTRLLERFFQMHDIEGLSGRANLTLPGGMVPMTPSGTPVKLRFLHNRSSIWSAIAALQAVEVDLAIRTRVTSGGSHADAASARADAIAAAERKLLVPEGGYSASGPPTNPPGKLMLVAKMAKEPQMMGNMEQDEFLAMVP